MNRRRLIRLGGIVGLSLMTFLPAVTTANEPIRVSTDDPLQATVDQAPGGSTLILSAGLHRGPLVIKQSLTIRGETGAVLAGSGRGSVLTLAAGGVDVEGLEITGSGRDLGHEDAGVLVLADKVRVARIQLRLNLHGIYVRGAKDALIENNHVIGLAATEKEPAVAGAETMLRADAIHHSPPGTQTLMGNGIHLWNANGAMIIANHIQHVRDGIYVAHTDNAVFRGNRIHNSRYGIHYMYSDDNVIEFNELWQNVAGSALMFSRNLQVAHNILRDHSGFRAYGLLLQDVEFSTFENNLVHGNLAGVRLQSCNSNTIRRNVIYGNLTGIILDSSSQDNAFTLNRVGPNLRQIELSGPPPPTEWSVGSLGNYWSGALPLDLNGKGVSSWPHHEVDLMAERRETFPVAQLLIGSPGIRAVEWALSRAPVPGMRFITDPHPLTRERSE
ncbi:MAG: right-handed parallel beta-helix repeat-containing protein [Phycisphaerales bacterium]|nr:right-handed parallel beta-helix repeat-containing protein [Phycisphaerales bacterium]